MEYDAYIERAMFFEASGRTVKALAGAIMRKAPAVEWIPGDEDFLETVTPEGESLEQLLRRVVENEVSVGRCGILVDAPEDSEGDANPYAAFYGAEAIINWRSALVDGRRRTVLVVLRESVEEPEEDGFAVESCEKYRVLRYGSALEYWGETSAEEEAEGFDADSTVEDMLPFYGLALSDLNSKIYWQEIWRKVEEDSPNKKKASAEKFILEKRVFPRKAGGLLWDEIPWKFVNPSDCEEGTHQPPLLPLVNVNLSHYRNSADIEHGLHFTALPTAWAAGFDLRQGSKLTIGSGVAWVAENPQAKAGYLEFTGAGLAAIKEEMDRKEKIMAALGSRMLEEQSKVGEAYETVRLRVAGEQSTLALVAQTVSDAMTQVLRWLAAWRRPGFAVDRIGLTLNQDFSIGRLDAQSLQTMMAAVQSALISWDTFFFNLHRGEIYPEGRTPDEESDLIAAGLPTGPALETDEEPEEDDEPEEDGDTEEDGEVDEGRD